MIDIISTEGLLIGNGWEFVIKLYIMVIFCYPNGLHEYCNSFQQSGLFRIPDMDFKKMVREPHDNQQLQGLFY